MQRNERVDMLAIDLGEFALIQPVLAYDVRTLHVHLSLHFY